LGYGICGTVLADRCKALGANVTVTGRRDATRMAAYRNDFAYLDITELGSYLTQHTVSYIFNTIPHLVLPKELLVAIDSSCTIVDIASSPGGLDYNYVNEHGLNATLYLGIPGKVAPKASAEVIYDIIKPYLIYQEQIKSNRKESSQCQQPL
jgi:dipicolinate synthase subunit A